MGEENNIFSGDCVLMMGNDVANLKPIGKVAESTSTFESEDKDDGLSKFENTLSLSLTSPEISKYLYKKTQAQQEKVLNTANRMLDRLKELHFLQREKCTNRSERRAYQKEIDKLSAMLVRYCKDYGLKIKKKDEI